MGFLILGLVILIGMHRVPEAPALRRSLTEYLGEGAYQVMFAMWSANRRGAVRASVKLSLNRDLVVITVGLGLYITIATLHPVLFGVAAVRGL